MAAPGVSSATQQDLDAAREQRAYLRMQIKVLERLRGRRQEAGEPAADIDRRLDEHRRNMHELDVRVETLRAALGRPHRQI